jgi:hypothetical protein
MTHPEAVTTDFSAASDLDREWFQLHPGRTFRLRPGTPAENSLGTTAVLVQQIVPGVRIRLGLRLPLPIPIDATEQDCLQLLKRK